MGQAVSPALPLSLINVIEWSLGRITPSLPVLAKMARDNMRAAGVYDASHVREYFHQAALHFANGLRVFRLAHKRDRVLQLARDQIDLDPSFDKLRELHARGQGAVLAPAHTCNYVLTLARLNLDVPICVYLRWSKHQQRVEMKRKWCEATGLQVIMEPPSSANPTARAALCVEALREGKILAMTPDLAQKEPEGIGVQAFGRRLFLPTGPASIAMLAEVPMIPVFGRLSGDRQVLYSTDPIGVVSLSRAEGGRKAGIQRAMQTWTDQFASFIREFPAAWFLWCDSRWTRVFRDDPEYAQPIESAGTLIGDHREAE
jgi:lauroyl/myristoyl acyltransferase